MKTRTGTNRFISIDKAIKYYAAYGFNRNDVVNKWKNLEIEIGEINKSEYKLDSDGRYWIEDLPDYDPVDFFN
jgi:hypothetical protein